MTHDHREVKNFDSYTNDCGSEKHASWVRLLNDRLARMHVRTTQRETAGEYRGRHEEM